MFLDIFEIFAEDCFLLGGFRKFLPSGFLPLIRDAEMTIKIIFERSSQKGGRQGGSKEDQPGTHLEILLSA